MLALLCALAAGTGTYLVLTSRLGPAAPRGLRPHRRSGTRPDPTTRPSLGRRADDWLTQAGLNGVHLREFALVVVTVSTLGSFGGFLLFGPVPGVLIGLAAGAAPVQLHRARRRERRATALESWPRLIEEIRVGTSALGRSVPQALFDAGLRGPVELRPAFETAQREWLLTFDFARTLDVLKAGLADPGADATCETLLVAHQVGGTDLTRRLADLAEDRQAEAAARKDARAKQAGVRFARRFVVIVPIGMALAGTSLGDGRSAYTTPTGQLLVVVALGLLALCWLWSGRYLELPEPERVFREPDRVAAARPVGPVPRPPGPTPGREADPAGAATAGPHRGTPRRRVA